MHITHAARGNYHQEYSASTQQSGNFDSGLLLLDGISKVATRYKTTIKLFIIKDTSDNKFLELAAECKSDFLITGNTNDFTMSSFGHTKIVSPKEYWEQYCF